MALCRKVIHLNVIFKTHRIKTVSIAKIRPHPNNTLFSVVQTLTQKLSLRKLTRWWKSNRPQL